VDVLWITLPIFALIGLGWIGAKRGIFDSSVATGLSRFVFWLAFPSLLLTSMAKAPPPQGDERMIYLVWIGVLGAGHLLARGIAMAMRLGPGAQAGVGLACSNGNTAFLGTAILAPLFDHHIMAVAAGLVALENIIITALGVGGLYLAKPAQDLKATLKAVLGGMANPVSMGALIGFGLAFYAVSVPAALMRPLEMLGAAASPAGLVALGIVMVANKATTASPPVRDIALVVLVKCIALPLMMAGAMTTLGAPTQITIAATILAACPSAVNVFIQAKQAQVWADQAAQAVLFTTLISIITLSVTVGLAVS
jgi:malonate transporter